MIEWCKSAGEFAARDLVTFAPGGLPATLGLVDQLLDAGHIELVIDDPDCGPLDLRYRARLTSSPASGDASTVEMERGKRPLYEEIALDQATGPSLARGTLFAFLELGEEVRANRAEFRARLQAELDSLVDVAEAGDGHLGSLEANRNFVVALNSLMDDLGFRLKEPKTGGPATLRVWLAPRGPETGYFGFSLVGTSSRGSYPRLPRLILVDRPENTKRTRS